MLGVKLVAKLYDVPPSDGVVTAFDAHHQSVYVGTDKGLVQRFSVTTEQSEDSDNVRIFTTIDVSTHVGKGEKKIARLQHCPNDNASVLYCLCGKVLYILDGVSLMPLQQIERGLGCFSVSLQRDGTNLVCASEKHGKAVHVFSIDPKRPKDEPKHVQELLLPESVECLVEQNNILCVGLRREYSMLSITDGDAKSLLALNGHEPQLCVGEGEVFLRLHNAVFVVSMRKMPSAKGSVLKRTIRFDSQPNCVVYRHPYLFAFSDNSCDVFCTYEDDVIERLPVPGCFLAGSQTSVPNVLFFASKTRLWMLQTQSLEAQLEDLVARYKVEDAFHLLHSQPTAIAATLQQTEVSLNVMAGFAYLHHNAPMFAIRHFNEHIDPREVLGHMPMLRPERVTPEGQDPEEDAFWSSWQPHHRHNKKTDLELEWRKTFEALPMGDDGDPSRRVMDGVAVEMAAYLTQARESFKAAMILWLRSLAATASPPQRRGIEYALLVLYLDANDHRSVFRLIMAETHLDLRDTVPLLTSAKRWRALMALYDRKGETEKADAVWKEHVEPKCTVDARRTEVIQKLVASLGSCPGTTTGEQLSDDSTGEGTIPPLPNNIDEIFFAVESLSLQYVASVVRERPDCLFATDIGGNTPLHVVTQLREPPARLSTSTSVGSPIPHSSEPPLTTRKLSLASYLVDSGASALVKNLAGLTPVDCAASFPDGHMNVGSLISCSIVRQRANTCGQSLDGQRFGVQGATSRAAGSWSGLVGPQEEPAS